MSTVDINHDFDFEIGTWKTHVRRLLEVESQFRKLQRWHYDPADHRRVQKWPRRVLQPGDFEWPPYPCQVCNFGYHDNLMQIRAGIFR